MNIINDYKKKTQSLNLFNKNQMFSFNKIILFLITIFLQYNLFADTKDSIKIKKIDSLVVKKYDYFGLEKDTTLLDTFTTANELIYEYRISKINENSIIKLQYNNVVGKFIDMYTIRKRNEMSLILARSEIFFPIYEEYLDKYNLPLELKYLSIIESGLNPNARSRSGAVGLWQFMYHTGKMLNLEINNYIDERKDPYKSTDAACRYINYLYNTFQDWELAIAAYNGGPGTVRNAIIKAGGETDFWKIRKYLPKQTQDYVPIFIAAYYSFLYHKEHGIYANKSEYNYYNIDTLVIRGGVSLYKIADEIGIPYSDLAFLNPKFKRGYIPNNKQNYMIVLPADKISDFLEIVNNKNFTVEEKETKPAKNYTKKIIHTVENGEYFHKIAINYGCTIENLKKWNKLDNNKVHPGQKLIIYL